MSLFRDQFLRLSQNLQRSREQDAEHEALGYYLIAETHERVEKMLIRLCALEALIKQKSPDMTANGDTK